MAGGAAALFAASSRRARGEWIDAGTMTVSRNYANVVRLLDGRLLITGGAQGQTVIAGAEVWSEKTRTFQPVADMNQIRVHHRTVLLHDGRVLITGGQQAQTQEEYLRSAELFDPKTGRFTQTASMAQARRGHAATRLQDGRVLVAGGNPRYWGTTATVEIYDPATGQWSNSPPLPEPRSWPASTLLADGRVAIMGGHLQDNGAPRTGFVSNTVTLEWTRTATLPERFFGAMVALALDVPLPGTRVPDAHRFVLIEKLETYGDKQPGRLAGYDPLTGAIAPYPELGDLRHASATAMHADGRMLIAGGNNILIDEDPITEFLQGIDLPRTAYEQVSARVDVLEPNGRRWRRGPDLPAPRESAAAIELSGGRVLILGGRNQSGPLDSALIWVPAQ